eukprot:5396604-Pyramimonas_sp.AAC.1
MDAIEGDRPPNGILIRRHQRAADPKPGDYRSAAPVLARDTPHRHLHQHGNRVAVHHLPAERPTVYIRGRGVYRGRGPIGREGSGLPTEQAPPRNDDDSNDNDNDDDDDDKQPTRRAGASS